MGQGSGKVTRRTLVEWLGKGAVLALGAPLFEACARDALGGLDAGLAGLDGSSAIDGSLPAGLDAGPLEDGGVSPEFPFAPGNGGDAIFDKWGERTVDSQDLAAILKSWSLTVDGMVERPRTLSFTDLLALPRVDRATDFHCVEGWSIYDVPWNGLSLSVLLDLVKPTAKATHVTFHTVKDTYSESLPLEVAREPHTLLGYGVGDATLPLPHGFPLRVVIPRLLGYKNAKYVYRIELTDHAIDGFWVAAGYTYDGLVPANRLRDGHY